MNIVPQEYWDKGYENYIIQKAPDNDPIVRLIKRTVPFAADNQQAYEMGCFPGRYLAVLGDLNYTLNGIDTTPSVSNMPAKLSEMGYKTQLFENKSFEHAERRQYDVVASFGFIEHFTNWKSVINEHARHVKENGYLVITTPNFKGIMQYLYHRLLDRENLKRHVISSMSPKKWKSHIEKEGFLVIESGYIGFDFWDEGKYSSIIARAVRKGIITISKYIYKLWPDNGAIAAYCYIVAKKK